MMLREFFLTEAMFQKAAYEFFASRIADIRSEPVRIDVAEWLCDVFSGIPGNYFDRERFMTWVRRNQKGGRYEVGGGSPKMQRRHFELLAHSIARLPQNEKKVFMINWLGGVLSAYYDAFDTDRWMAACRKEDDAS